MATMLNTKIFDRTSQPGPVPRPPTQHGMPSSWRGPEAQDAGRAIAVDCELREPGLVLVRASGALNGHTYNDLIDTLRGLFEAGLYRLIIDLTGVNQMSSAGAAACAAAAGIAADHDGRVALCTPSPRVQQFLNVLGIDQLATVYGDTASAFDGLRDAAPE